LTARVWVNSPIDSIGDIVAKSVLITGAGSGFGKGAALALAGRGHQVIATTETEDQADALRAEAPQLTVEKVDITSADVEKAAAWDVDVLINNAGAGQTGPMADVPLDRVRRLFEVNVFGTLAITQRVLPRMVAKGAGRIIIVSSIAGVVSGPSFGPYSMTKHALEAMGKSMRAELSAQGIDVTLLNPGPYLTGFNDRMADSMWEWFGEGSLNAPATPLFEMMRDLVTKGQLDPAEVVTRMVELTEAETTMENNFVPPDILGQMGVG
jgi:NAD(P)-dependent dehydrogenase (short-subunit alcohol dehydrogenase family)